MTQCPQSSQLLRDKELRDVASLLYKSSLSGLFITFIAFSILVFIFSEAVSTTVKYAWYGFMVLTLVTRIIDTWYSNKKISQQEFDGKQYCTRFTSGVFVTCIGWAVYPFISFSQLSLIELMCTLIIIGGMCGGATTVLATSRVLVMMYISMLLLPMAYCCLFLPDNPNIFYVGILVVLYWLFMLNAANRSSNFISHAILINNQNDNLLEEMATEKTNLQVVHGKLNRAYEELNNANETLEQKVAKRTHELEKLATKDNLTGLLNRNAFLDILEKAMSETQNQSDKLVIFFIDLDGFKEVNDLKGHIIGDALLQTLAERLSCQENFADNCCRWGGDEFIVYKKIRDKEQALQIAQSIHDLINQPVDIHYNQIKVGATIGISLYPEDSQNAADLIHAADVAMYSQKRTARGGARFFLPEMLTDIQRTQTLKEGLQHAISKKELYLVYQPIVDAVTEKPVSFEALLRWTFNGEYISTEKFIDIAEDSGSIHEIGEWVLKQACLDAVKWNALIPAKVSVNVSVKQLLRENFVTLVSDALVLSGLPAERLKLEITESVFAENMTQIAGLLSELKAQGMQISIDDFGTGFSSLAYLQSMPMDEIKIDRAFITNIKTSGNAIIKATLSIAKAFNCEVIAEGIEKPSHSEELRQLGVHQLQGFLYSKPISLEELLEKYQN
jgi:diguanylate cyclase (GGDEF)-like protein